MQKTGSRTAAKTQAAHTAMLVTASVIWGMTFVSQSMGAQYVGTFTFIAVRNWIAALFLLAVVLIRERFLLRPKGRTCFPSSRRQKKFLLAGSVLTGLLLLTANGIQQAGIAYTTTAKAGFITALYVVIVPVIYSLRGKRQSGQLWICVGLSVLGLYLLCSPGGSGGINKGDLMMIVSAFFFAMEIMALGMYSRITDGILLSLGQVLTNAVVATPLMFLMEKPSPEAVMQAMLPIAYAGIVSSGVAYTLQIVAQKGMNTVVASVVMCMESVFSAVGGWIFLGQTLSLSELAGCGIVFAALVLSQIPLSVLTPRKLAEENHD